MRKIILTMGLVFLTATNALAGCNYTEKCAPKAYDISSKTGQNISKYTGSTFIAEKIAQAIIKKELKKATKEKFKVKINSYSAGDLARGRFKSLEITGKNLEIDGTYITLLELKTLCPFNYVKVEKDKIKFRENMVMGFKTEITNDDLRKTMQSGGYLEMLNKINLSALGITFLKLNNADVQIKNNKLYFSMKVTSSLLLSKPMNVVVAADLKVEDGRIVVTKVDFVNIFTRVDLSSITYLLNAINPLNFSLDVLENKNTKMNIKTLTIIGDKITTEGIILIPKNVK